MIKSKEDYLFYLEADRIAKSLSAKNSLVKKIMRVIDPDYIWKFQKNLRKLEFYTNCKRGFFSNVARLIILRRHKRLSLKLGFSIPVNVFGPGLSIAHYGTIIVNEGAKVGTNCRLHAGVNIGTEAGYGNKAPKIGDNCYIGPGVKIYGEIVIPNGTAIGANAVVNKSFSEENTAIAGIPARKISELNIFDIIIPGTEIIKLGLNKKDLSGIPAKELNEMIKSNGIV
jgi:serine O-acetyltransferase